MLCVGKGPQGQTHKLCVGKGPHGQTHRPCNCLNQEREPIRRHIAQKLHPPVPALNGRCLHRRAPFTHIKVHKLAVVLPCANQTGVLQGDTGISVQRSVECHLGSLMFCRGSRAGSNRSWAGHIGTEPVTKMSFEVSWQQPGML